MIRDVLRRSLSGALCALLPLLATPAAATVDVPVAIPYALVRNALAERVFVEPGERVQVLTDKSRCNSLVLSAPRIEGSGDGFMRVLVRMEARGGTPVGTSCMLPFDWKGTIELRESAFIADIPQAVAFRIIDSNLLDETGTRRSVPGVLWNWVKLYVHPRMEAFTFDLSPLFAGTRDMLAGATLATPEAIAISVDSLHLASATPSAAALTTVFAFEPPYVPAAQLDAAAAAPLSAEELAAWDAAWQAWDAFATWAIKVFAANASAELRVALLETLVEARYELRDALASPVRQADPVRALFRSTWTRLAPLVADAGLTVNGADALRYMVFVSAGDALTALDSAAGAVGLRVDQDTLQRLARALLPAVSAQDLTYTTAVDPDLRELFGFPPLLEMAAADGATSPWVTSRRWLLADAQAAGSDDGTARQLNGWVPDAGDLDRYIASMEALLADIVVSEEQRGKIAAPFLPVYRALVRATAWQETCWRQYVEQRGEVVPLRSSAGSVGLMQINKHVWRNIYALDRLEKDVAYNARAGNEILVHYLVDYAIKKKEHEASGDLHNLARASYAVYNGGPGHLRRYRDPAEKPALKAIDDAFWKKYRAIRDTGPEAVKSCYGDG